MKVLVTGASAGMGKGVAKILARRDGELIGFPYLAKMLIMEIHGSK